MISIILPLFNKRGYIEATIKSVQAQIFTAWELIIIDDVSEDASLDIAKSYAKEDARIRVFQNETNKGANFCRNIGIRHSKGKYIMFLDADDLLTPECLDNRVTVMESNPGIDAAIFTMEVFRERIGDLRRLWVPREESALQRFLAHDLPWHTMQPIWRKEFIDKTDGFDESFPRLQDVEFHTRSLLYNQLIFKVIVKDPDCYFRTGEARKVFNAYSFLDKWVEASLMYYQKFFIPAKAQSMAHYLKGTLYHTYLQVLWQYKIKNISKENFYQLEKKIFSFFDSSEMPRFIIFLFRIAGLVNLLPVPLPGMNFTIRKLIINQSNK